MMRFEWLINPGVVVRQGLEAVVTMLGKHPGRGGPAHIRMIEVSRELVAVSPPPNCDRQSQKT